ncbi:MAG: hypothetical protein BWX61_01331 [Bacteroidetes bacterium ADurb.Bin035]|nr:MAG: hypothetical protein BWX61_01331 [Bacteroidetes bacterium ADurb.Bin035]
MIVPVLSKRITLISLAIWIASPFLIIRPFLAATPLDVTRAIGVAKPRAHGQAITKVATKEKMAVDKAPASVIIHGKIFAALCKKGKYNS